MYYILHGEEEFARSEWLARAQKKLFGDDPSTSEFNTCLLDGKRLNFGELRHTCDVIPFMGKVRVVVVQDLLTRLARSRGRKGQEPEPQDEPAWKREFVKNLTAYLPELPSTTSLFFLESKLLQPSHPILKLALKQAKENGTVVKHFRVPKQHELTGWIQRRCRAKGGRLSPDAVNLLAALVGPDLRLLDQEIEKLLLYAAGEQVSAQDVRRLVTRARDESIFDLVDCLGLGQSDRALVHLHRLLEDGREPLYVLAMLARQVRLLMQVGELRKQGLSEAQMTSRLSLHPYVVKKVLAQAPRFRMDQLDAAHERLLEADWAIKTGEMEDVLALDMLVVNLTSGNPSHP